MTGLDLVVRARRIVTPTGAAPAAVGVRDGRIAAVAPYADELDAARTVTLDGDAVLLPGLVDSHVHVNEPGRTEWEGFATGTAAAAAGGITTIVDMPLNSVPPTVDTAALAVKRAAAAGQVHVDVAFWGGAVPASLGGLRALHDAGVVGVKCFLLDSGVPEFPPLDPGQLRAALAELAVFDG
ncbi:MAG: amidohydrolase family protein, partial [Mycobacteriales bacterium]